MKTEKICAECGQSLSNEEKKCPNCGSEKFKTKVELEEGDEPNGPDR